MEEMTIGQMRDEGVRIKENMADSVVMMVEGASALVDVIRQFNRTNQELDALINRFKV